MKLSFQKLYLYLRVVAHQYNPFWDLGTTKGLGFKPTQWCACEILVGSCAHELELGVPIAY